MSARIRRIGIVLGFVLALAVACGYLTMSHDKQKAERMLAVTASLRPGSNIDKNAIDSYFAMDCQSNRCNYTATVENTWLHRLALAPRAQFRAVISVTNGRVLSTKVVLQQNAGVTIIDRDDDPVLKSFNVLSKNNYMMIILTPRSTESERKAALGLNLRVLNRRDPVTEPYQLFNSRPPESRN
jgi:hypothetical protein